MSCLQCWVDTASPLASHSVLLDSGKDHHEKKVSLKKYNQSRLKRSGFQIPIATHVVMEPYSKTARVYQARSTEASRMETPIKMGAVVDIRSASQPQWPAFPQQTSYLVSS